MGELTPRLNLNPDQERLRTPALGFYV